MNLRFNYSFKLDHTLKLYKFLKCAFGDAKIKFKIQL